MRNTDAVYIWKEKINFISLMSEEWIYTTIMVEMNYRSQGNQFLSN